MKKGAWGRFYRRLPRGQRRTRLFPLLRGHNRRNGIHRYGRLYREMPKEAHRGRKSQNAKNLSAKSRGYPQGSRRFLYQRFLRGGWCAFRARFYVKSHRPREQGRGKERLEAWIYQRPMHLQRRRFCRHLRYFLYIRKALLRLRPFRKR